MINIARIADAVIAATGVIVVVRAEGDTPSLFVPEGTAESKKQEAEKAFQNAVATERAAAHSADAAGWLLEQEKALRVVVEGVEYESGAVLDLLTAVLLGGKENHPVVDASGAVHQISPKQAETALAAISQKRSLILTRYRNLRRS